MDIREYLDTYNISEECKQSILELFDRPSLGRTMWDAMGMNGITSKSKEKAKEKEPEVKQEEPKGPTKKEQIRSYLNKKRKHQGLTNKVDKAADNYNFKYYDYEAVKDSDYAEPSEVAKYQHDASQAKSKLIKAKKEADVNKSEIVSDRKKLFPKSPKISGRLPVYKKGTGKFKEIKESLEASLTELNSLFEEIGTAIGGMMDAQPINLAGKPHPSCKQKKAQLNYKYKKLRRKEV